MGHYKHSKLPNVKMELVFDEVPPEETSNVGEITAVQVHPKGWMYYPVPDYIRSNMSSSFIIGWQAGYAAAMKEMATQTVTTTGNFTMPEVGDEIDDSA